VAVKKTYPYDDFADSILNFKDNYDSDINHECYFGFPIAPLLRSEENLLNPKKRSIAYFSMEYGLAPSIYHSFSQLRPLSEKNKFFQHEVFSNYWLCDYIFKIQINKLLDLPIYSGGLGVLAGDAMKSSADLGLPVVGIGILWNKGYFRQKFWYKHGQVPEELRWDPHSYPGLVPLKQIVKIDTKEGVLHLRLWKYYIYSYDYKNVCPLILLDSNLPENSEQFRNLTDQLYRSDNVRWKIFQRAILGIGGVKALEALGYYMECYHLNEGHAAFAFIEKYVQLQDKNQMAELKQKFTYTCHTPVLAGHDRFRSGDVRNILEDEYASAVEMFGKEKPSSDEVNLTYLALNNCCKVNAVSKKHGEVMRLQFPDYASKIDTITNGVHTHTWVSESMAKLFDKYEHPFGDWRADTGALAKITTLKSDLDFRKQLFEAHMDNKRQLIAILKNWRVKENIFTISWARRIAAYKRPALILHNIERLIEIAKNIGPLQIVMAGKAHPNDNLGAAHIDEILNRIDQLNSHKNIIRVLMLENYDTYFGKMLTNSVDVWLNNPLPPFEASGTSGMKAIVNGVLQMSTLDGWVMEAAHDDIGWFFGYQHKGPELGRETDSRLSEDSIALGDVLEKSMKLYYETYRDGKINAQSVWIDKMINCIRQSAFFSTQRMIRQYHDHMWKKEDLSVPTH